MSTNTITITKDNFKELVLESTKPVLVDFWASWCGPCKRLAPVLDEIASEYPQYVIAKVNVDEQGELSQMFDIMSIPTMIVFKDGKATNRVSGAMPKQNILQLF